MTRTEFKRRLPGYIATGLVILTTSFWTLWGVGEMYVEGWGMPFPEPMRYLVLGAVCLALTLVALTWPRVGGWLILVIGGAFTAWWWTLAAGRGWLTWEWVLGTFPASSVAPKDGHRQRIGFAVTCATSWPSASRCWWPSPSRPSSPPSP